MSHHIGSNYGHLKVLSVGSVHIFPSGQKRQKYLCCCTYKNCGNTTEVFLSDLKSGNTVSCGCFREEEASRKFTTHGLTNHPLRKILSEMKYRCYNDNCKQFKDYGGRGISICNSWLVKGGIVKFIQWNDSLPKNKRYKKGLEIDRIDTNGNYNPENCRWVTSQVNNNNRRNNITINYKDKKYSFCDFWRKYGREVKYATALWRIKKGWDPIKAVRS